MELTKNRFSLKDFVLLHDHLVGYEALAAEYGVDLKEL
jgi:hypothetical protein